MDFGKTASFAKVKFCYEKLPEMNSRFLGNSSHSDFSFRLGCPVWAHPSFIGQIYSESLSSKEYLKHYQNCFNSIELNSSFYGIPSLELVSNWSSKIETDFKFCPKFSKVISHRQNLGSNIDEVRAFIKVLNKFKESNLLGMSFFQLPAHFSADNLSSFLKFADRFPKVLPIAFEFRHHSWFASKDVMERVADFLHERNKSLVISDVAGRRDVCHFLIPGNRAFVRFAGNSLHHSDFERLDSWKEIILKWRQSGIQEIFFFLHQPKEGNCIRLAKYLNDILTPEGISFPYPELQGASPQMEFSL